MMATLWWLLCAHVLADFVLQSTEMAYLKRPSYTEHRTTAGPWWVWMTAHGLVNGMVTAWVLGVWWVGPLEAGWHGVTDYLKVTKRIGFWADQGSHLLAKLVWLWLIR